MAQLQASDTSELIRQQAIRNFIEWSLAELVSQKFDAKSKDIVEKADERLEGLCCLVIKCGMQDVFEKVKRELFL